jgi:hypothetical protein
MDYLDPSTLIDQCQLAFPQVTSVNTEIYLPMVLESPSLATSQHWVVAVADLFRSRLLVFNILASQPHIYPGLIAYRHAMSLFVSASKRCHCLIILITVTVDSKMMIEIVVRRLFEML